jgi:transcriptional regulator with XRE-family HTH domain
MRDACAAEGCPRRRPSACPVSEDEAKAQAAVRAALAAFPKEPPSLLKDSKMNSNDKPTTERPRNETQLGLLIRQWRDRRGRSQQQLSADMGVSQRHLSFVESGRSVPSRALLISLAEALTIPLRDRNLMLLAAGFAPIYSEQAWNSAEMRPLALAVERVLRQHEPLPAVVLDRRWNVLAANRFVDCFFGLFFELTNQIGEQNLLRLILDPGAMRPAIANWDEVARGVLERINRESVTGPTATEERDLVTQAVGIPSATINWAAKDRPGALPATAFSFMKDGQVLKYFSMSSTVSMPQTVAAEELRIECFYPADHATEAWHTQTFCTTI